MRPGAAWKGGLSRARVHYSSADASSRPLSTGDAGLDSPDEAQEVLHACLDDMIELWHDNAVRRVLKRKKVRIEEFPGL